jgi:hypothetical protein
MRLSGLELTACITKLQTGPSMFDPARGVLSDAADAASTTNPGEHARPSGLSDRSEHLLTLTV